MNINTNSGSGKEAESWPLHIPNGPNKLASGLAGQGQRNKEEGQVWEWAGSCWSYGLPFLAWQNNIGMGVEIRVHHAWVWKSTILTILRTIAQELPFSARTLRWNPLFRKINQNFPTEKIVIHGNWPLWKRNKVSRTSEEHHGVRGVKYIKSILS